MVIIMNFAFDPVVGTSAIALEYRATATSRISQLPLLGVSQHFFMTTRKGRRTAELAERQVPWPGFEPRPAGL